jgi:hypothetical protein
MNEHVPNSRSANRVKDLNVLPAKKTEYRFDARLFQRVGDDLNTSC